MGDLIDGVQAVLWFFALAVVIATIMVFWYTRCVRSTFLVVFASMLAVVWQLGIFAYARLCIRSVFDPSAFSGVRYWYEPWRAENEWHMQDVGRGFDKLVAARFTFRRLFLAGLTALLADAVGFAVL